jgi:hypothetical protein
MHTCRMSRNLGDTGLGEGDTLLHEVVGEGDHWAMGVEQQRWAKATQGDGRTTFLNSSEAMCLLGW